MDSSGSPERGQFPSLPRQQGCSPGTHPGLSTLTPGKDPGQVAGALRGVLTVFHPTASRSPRSTAGPLLHRHHCCASGMGPPGTGGLGGRHPHCGKQRMPSKQHGGPSTANPMSRHSLRHGEVRAQKLQSSPPQPGQRGSGQGAPDCQPKGHPFSSQSGHTPELQARSPVGGMLEATTP